MNALRRDRGIAIRRAILNAGSQEFADKGFEGASMRGIARACGLKLTHLQYHIGDKAELWSAVVDDIFAAFLGELDELMISRSANEPSAEMIAAWLEALVRHAASQPMFVGIMAHARIKPTPAASKLSEKVHSRTLWVVALVRQAQADGDFVAGDPGLLFYIMLGGAIRIFMTSVDAEQVIGRPVSDSRLLDAHIATCVRTFMPAYAARTPRWRGTPAQAGG